MRWFESKMLNIPKYQINDRVISDLAKRSTIGIPVYVILWGIIIFMTGLYKREPFLSFSLFIVFLGISLLRIVHQRYFQQMAKSHRDLNYSFLLVSIWSPAILWGTAFAVFMLGPDDSDLKVLMLMTTAGLCSGGISTYAPNRWLAVSYIAILLLPTAILILFLNRAETHTSLLILTYFCFLSVLGARGTREYWVALENEAKLEEKTRELERINEIDGLTGVYNRRYFDKIFDIEWKRASREKNALTLILLDLDHFKNVNDTYGHLAGDEFLKESAKVFQSIFKRSTDVIARYGGEEFVILLPGIDLKSASLLSESLRKQIENLRIVYNGFEIQTTVSLGIASRSSDYRESNESLIMDADEALYRAKKKGRNQVQIKY